MALVAGASHGGCGGRGRLNFSALLRRLYPVLWRRLLGGSPSERRTSDEADERLLPINPASSSSAYTSRGRELDSSRTSGPTLPTPLGHLRWLARDLFGVGTARREGARGSLEMAISTQQAPRLPPMAVVEATPGQLPTLPISVTDGMLASFLAFQQGVQVDVTDGASMTAKRASTPASSASKGEPTEWMQVFRALLLAHVFFALPLLLVFFPRYEKEKAKDNLLLSLVDRNEDSTGKLIVLALFVIQASLGSLGVLLAHIAYGPMCMHVVGSLTLCTIISIVALVDYILLKTLPDDTTYQLVFLVHFIVMLLVICCLWAKFVWISQCCSSQDTDREQGPRHRPPV